MSSRCRSRRALGFVAAIPPRTLSQTGAKDPTPDAKTNTVTKTNTRTGRCNHNGRDTVGETLTILSSPKSLRAESARLLLADGAPTVGRGKTFLAVNQVFFTKTAVTPERKVEKSFPRWEINSHVEG